MPPPSPAPDASPFEQAKALFFAGLASQQAGRFEQAEQHYQAALRWLPGRASTLINLAATQLRLARPLDALASADAALAAEPDAADALLHRATALAQLNRPHDALAAYDRLLAIDPTHAPAWSGSGNLLRELQRPDAAAHAFRQAQRHGGDAALHAYYLASVSPTVAPPVAPAAYVRSLFDDYADTFDAHLVEQLHYQAHRHLVDGLLRVAGGRWESALDLGCGTGLCGPLVRPLVQRLTGVDLSARMLDKARERGVYDRLEQADAVDFLGRGDERHDLVLAADVFIYIGDLRPVFAAVQRAMRGGGVFCFTAELLDDADAADAAGGTGFKLLPSLRYAHAVPSLRRLAAEQGFDVLALDNGPVRQDQRAAVGGLYVHLRRRADRGAPT